MKPVCVLKGLVRAALELLFPFLCLACNKQLGQQRRILFCDDCIDEIKKITSPYCSCCGKMFAGRVGRNHLCSVCLKGRWNFSLARAPMIYAPPISRAIFALKYSGKTEGLGSFKELMATSQVVKDFFVPDIIVPVPLHLSRLRERGFNQAYELAREIFDSQRKKICSDILVRTINTKAQTNLDGKQRRKNVRGAFRVVGDTKIKNKKIMLVDDVFTTGATVNECAGTLRKAGAGDIQVMTLARAADYV